MLTTVLIFAFFFQDTQSFSVLCYLHHIFPPQEKLEIDETSTKHRKKFFLDAQESFAVLADTQTEVDAKLKLLNV